MKNILKNKSGFTLIELIIVVSIIGILATSIISFLNPVEYQKVSRDSLRISNLNSISQALELYFADNKSYPTAPTGNDYTALTTALKIYNSRISFSDPSNCLISYTPSGAGAYVLTTIKESKSFSVPSGQTLVKVETFGVDGCSAQNSNQVIRLYGGQ